MTAAGGQAGPPAAGLSITERLVGALSAGWRAIQERHPDVPDVVLTIGSGTAGRRGATLLGHFARSRWQRGEGQDAGVHELFIGGEGLARGAVDVHGTMLHEAAHGLAAARGIKDTAREGRYHNRRFAALAEELGLVVEEEGSRGWSATRVPPATADRYDGVLEHLAAALTAYRRTDVPGTTRPKDRNNVLATCECPRRIRVSRTELARGGITCTFCEAPFTVGGQADEDT